MALEAIALRSANVLFLDLGHKLSIDEVSVSFDYYSFTLWRDRFL
jgi:hypothetical protein